MTTFDFDAEIDRSGTHAIKWEVVKRGDRFVPVDHHTNEPRLLPMWVADMDFRCPPAVVEALTARAQHGIYGYTTARPSLTGWHGGKAGSLSAIGF